MHNRLLRGSPHVCFYGLNVAKVPEIMPVPVLTKGPYMTDYAEALAEVRDDVISINI